MAIGWIKLYRSLMENDLWQDKPFSRGQAWIDLLFLASHKDTEFYFNGTLIPLKKGEMITSKKKLGIRWGWSNSKIDKFLNELEKTSMLSTKSDTKKTTIKIAKYGKYQAFDAIPCLSETLQKTYQKRTKNETEADQKRNKNETKTKQKRTFNNIKNIKNDKNVKERKDVLPSADSPPSENYNIEQDFEYEEMCKRLDERKRGKRNGHL